MTDQEAAEAPPLPEATPIAVSGVEVEYVDNVDVPVYVQGAFVLAGVTGDVTLVFYTENPGHQSHVELEVNPPPQGESSGSVHDPGPFVADKGMVHLKRTFNAKVVFNRTVAQRVIDLLEGVTRGTAE